MGFYKVINSLKRDVRQLIGVPSYWMPYNLFNGKAVSPQNVDIELTFNCNLKCKICPQQLYKSKQKEQTEAELAPKIADSEELNRDEIIGLIGDLARMGVKIITLTGGEPFLRPDLLEIVSAVKKHRLLCNILTNGMLIKEAYAQKLVELGVDTVTFSIDGPLQVHDEIRQVKGAYDKVGRSIKAIQDCKKQQGKHRPYLGINCTISALNQNSFSQLIHTASEYGISAVNFAYLFFTDEKALEQTAKLVDFKQAKEEDQVLPEQLRAVNLGDLKEEICRCFDLAAQSNILVNFSPPLNDRELQMYFYDSNYAYSSKCFLPWYSGRINPYGDVYPCSIDVKIGNIRQTPYSMLWNSPRYKNFRNTLKKQGLFPKCTKCCNLNTKLWNYLPSIR